MCRSGSDQNFQPDKKNWSATSRFFSPEIQLNLTQPKFYTQKIRFDPIRPDHVTGQAQAKKLSLMVGSGRVRAEEKSVGFFDPIRPDKWSGLSFLPLIPDVF